MVFEQILDTGPKLTGFKAQSVVPLTADPGKVLSYWLDMTLIVLTWS